MNTCGVIRENEIIGTCDLDYKINYILSSLGIRHAMKGYQYLMEGIKMGIEDPESINYITKILYIKLARKFKKTPSVIERNIRSAINSMPLSKYRAIVFSNDMGHYSNKEFILHITHYVQYMMN